MRDSATARSGEGEIAGGGAIVLREIDELNRTKADRVTGATAGNLAELDRDGNLMDSGIKAVDVLTMRDIGIAPGDVVTVGPDGRIDSRLYEHSAGGTELPAAPMDGNRYVLLATSAGTKEWIRVRDTFVKNW
jgi:hypothetical protein